ncbi:Mss4-like protein [Xylaria bambusicola]|uniref:Mss4-like protein n=1 Tax=Xylaria bambusicola TaxID=326684 RepID=UPI002007F014|nr:Mss4-like protein [Xylaria bambusicola]KAI0505202.1 Mss4-like protein [Xylaria bambusicola]
MADNATQNDSIELVAECLCKAHRFTTHVPRSSLPLSSIYCHCDSCRRVTGALYSTYLPWPGSRSSIHERIQTSRLKRYAFSESTTLFSCETCSSTLFAATPARDGSDVPDYGVTTGVLHNTSVPNFIDIAHHIFLSDTKDGGATPWLCDSNSSSAARPRLWSGRSGSSEELSSTDHKWALPLNAPIPASTPVRCHCGGVDLVLRNPIPDFAVLNRSELPWFVDPESNKSLGGFDVCDSCRVSSGVDIFHWTFAQLAHIAFATPDSSSHFPSSTHDLAAALTSPHRDPRLGTLTMYQSSSDVQRYFCSACSAAVFYATDARAEMVDLSIGLLRSSHGSRAEELVSWDFGGRAVWREDVAGGWREGFIQSVEAAAERWRIGRGLPKNFRRVQKEEAAAAAAAADQE